jgi:hypothetical protein
VGRAARANPISHEGGKSPEQVAFARIVRGCTFIKTPKQLELLLDRIQERDPEARRDVIRDYLWEFCAFDPDAIEWEEKVAEARRRYAAAYTIPHVINDVTAHWRDTDHYDKVIAAAATLAKTAKAMKAPPDAAD